MSTLALVESPAQLLNVLEWAHHTGADLSLLTTVVLAPANDMSRLQLASVTGLARGLGHTVRWHEPRQGAASSARTVGSLTAELHGVSRLIVGDPFSGVIQVVLALSKAAEVVVVDDGTATMEFARLYHSGEDLVRWHSRSTGGHRRQIAALARRRLAARNCRLSLFTCMPVQLDGVEIVRNDFAWVRTCFPAPRVKPSGDLVERGTRQGSALPSHPVRMHQQDAVQLGPGVAALGIPPAGPDRQVVGTVVRLAGQLDAEKTVAGGPGHQQHRPVLAPTVVLLVRHPGPDDLARIGISVGVRGVVERGRGERPRIRIIGGSRTLPAG